MCGVVTGKTSAGGVWVGLDVGLVLGVEVVAWCV